MNIQWKTGRALPFYSEWFLRDPEWDLLFSKTRRREKRGGESAFISASLSANIYSIVARFLRPLLPIRGHGYAYLYVLIRAGYLRVSVNLLVRARTQQGHKGVIRQTVSRIRPMRYEHALSVPSSLSRYRPFPPTGADSPREMDRSKGGNGPDVCYLTVSHAFVIPSRVSPILTRRAEILHSDFID